jgi:hypothetical protein
MGMPITVTLSSVGVSRHVNLDWASGQDLAFAVSGSSSGTFTYTVEGTLRDIQSTAALVWFSLSSATTTNSSLSGSLVPIAGIRLNASAISSAVLSLDILQGIGT